MFHMISAAENLFHMCTIIYSFVITSGTSTHSMHAVQSLWLYMFDAVILIFLSTYVPTSTTVFNKRQRANVTWHLLISVYRSRCWWTSCSPHTHGLNVYVTVDLFMKYNKCSHCMIWHIYAFICGERAAVQNVKATCSRLMNVERKKRLGCLTKPVFTGWFLAAQL